MVTKHTCYDCSKEATWCNLASSNADPATHYFCDDHVPRGCSCNQVLKPFVVEIVDSSGNILNPPDDYHEPLDDQGRLSPCCEFLHYSYGFLIEPDEIEQVDLREGE